LLGTALLLDSHPVLRGRALSQAIAAFGLLLALTSAIGYLYSVTSLVSLSDYKPIAPQTATAFLLSFCVLFLATPRKGVMHTILSPELGGILSRRLLAFVVLVPLLAGGIASAGLRLRLFDGTAAILFLTAAADLSLAGLLLTNAFSINASEKRRKSALVSLRESERTYRTLFELAADPMFLVDAGLTVLEANAAASHSLGRARVELKGREIAEIASTCAAEMTCNLAQAFERGSSAFESCARSSDGRDVPLEINARLIDFRGHPAVLVIARDLSERKAAERSLAEKESLLQQAQKMEAIGRLAGGVAHDFNNLLTVIMGYSELLIGKLPSQHDAQTDAFQIKACALKAAALTRQLLAFSRKQPASPRRVVLNDVLTEMSPLLRRLIGERIELVVRRQASRSSIRIDPSQLEQVVLNLSVNARDAMPGGGKLTIESRERTIQGVCPPYAPPPTDGVYVELVVEDTGTGIAPEIIPHIFEPFFTTKCGSQGTGLGLSTVYGIVTQNGGSIGVDSPPQGGASMRLLFPLLLGDPVEAEVEIDVRHSAVGRRETVLLIEDEISVRVYLGSVLRRAGYNVLEAEQGETALGTVRS
ncbi:MAG TPA: ATP-binding protein, partial [Spirochaetia bacterium]